MGDPFDKNPKFLVGFGIYSAWNLFRRYEKSVWKNPNSRYKCEQIIAINEFYTKYPILEIISTIFVHRESVSLDSAGNTVYWNFYESV